MTLVGREFLHLIAGAAVFPVTASRLAWAQDMARPVRVATGLFATWQNTAWLGAEAGIYKKHGIDMTLPAIAVGGPQATPGVVRGGLGVRAYRYVDAFSETPFPTGEVNIRPGWINMTLPHRRQFLRLAAGAAALPALPRMALAQAYPTRPVRIIVGYPAGGPTDVVARLMGQWLSERLGQPFIVENRPGAATNIATAAVVRAPADGYTLLLLDTAGAFNATLYDKLNFNLIRDIAPVAGIVRAPSVLEVNPSVPVKTVPELIAYAKANPGKLNMASSGIGAPSQVFGELFKIMTGVNLVNVSYRGAPPAVTDLLAGRVQVYFDPIPNSIGYIRGGKVRPLAITSATRSKALPDLPTVSEFVPGYEASIWWGVGAPKATPSEIVDKLNKEINAALDDPKMTARFADFGGVALPGSPAEFGKLIADETEKWAKVIKTAGIKPQ